MTAIMVDVDIRDFSAEDWNRLACGLSGFNLMQCWEWGEAKARTGAWRVERGTLCLDGHAVGAFQALVRRLPGGLPGGLAWINRAPLWRTDGGAAALSDMMEALRRHYAEERGLYLRLAPAQDESEAEDGGLALAGVEGWASAVLDLSRPVEDLRLGLRQKWRNALNKAERPGLEVRTGRDAGLFAEFLDGYRHMTRDRGFATSVTPELLAALQSVLPAERRMETFIATQGGAIAGAVLIVRHGDTAEYLAGTVAEAGRAVNAGQLLLWRAVVEMRKQGLRCFDLGGLDARLTPPGIHRFKEGLGGVPYRLAPELEVLGGGLLGRLVRWRVRAARSSG